MNVDPREPVFEGAASIRTFEELFADAYPALYESLAPVIVDPKWEMLTGCCDRCGVVPADREAHRQWHRNLTLGINGAHWLALQVGAGVKEAMEELLRGDVEALAARSAKAKENEG